MNQFKKKQQSFEEYTDQRVADWKILSDHLPDLVYNYEVYSLSKNISKHMYDVKERLDIIFNRDLNWQSVDGYSQTIMHYLRSQIKESPTTEDEAIQLQVNVRKKFCEFIGCEFPEDKIEDYIHTLKESNKQTKQFYDNLNNNKE